MSVILYLSLIIENMEKVLTMSDKYGIKDVIKIDIDLMSFHTLLPHLVLIEVSNQPEVWEWTHLHIIQIRYL